MPSLAPTVDIATAHALEPTVVPASQPTLAPALATDLSRAPVHAKIKRFNNVQAYDEILLEAVRVMDVHNIQHGKKGEKGEAF